MRRLSMIAVTTAVVISALASPVPDRSQVPFACEAKEGQSYCSLSPKKDPVQAWWDCLPWEQARELYSDVLGEDLIRDIHLSHLVDENIDLSHAYASDEDHHPDHGHGHHGHRGPSFPDKTIYEVISECEHVSRFFKLVEEHDGIKELLDDDKHNHTLLLPTNGAFCRRRCRHGHHGHDGHGDHDGHGGHGHDGDHDHSSDNESDSDHDGDHNHGHDHHHDHDHDGNHDHDGDHHHCPHWKEFIDSLLHYHILPGRWPLCRIRHSKTIPTSLHPPGLGFSSELSPKYHHHHPQRIRSFTTPFLQRTYLNFRTVLTPHTVTIHAKNGIIHLIDSLLIPPPNQTTALRLLPSHFSTLTLALETTGLASELADLPRSGGATFFAPDNHAWMRLGRRANAFLFSEHGKPYLKALVKYHVALNETLYSDAFYSGKKGHHDGNEMEAGFGFGYEHVDLTTLLHDLPLSVDIRRWHGWVTILVNGFTRVLIRDGVAADGVIHVIDQVLVPPCKHGGNGENLKSGEVSVEELKARLEPYVEDETRLSGAAMMDTCTQEALYMKKAGQKYVAAIGDL